MKSAYPSTTARGIDALFCLRATACEGLVLMCFWATGTSASQHDHTGRRRTARQASNCLGELRGAEFWQQPAAEEKAQDQVKYGRTEVGGGREGSPAKFTDHLNPAGPGPLRGADAAGDLAARLRSRRTAAIS